MEKLEILSASELINMPQMRDKKFKHVESNKTLLIDTSMSGHWYEIDLDEINDHAGLLHWTLHLLEKRWFDGLTARQFILRVSEIKGWRFQ